MKQTATDVPDAELRVLEVLWQQSPATVRAISERLYPRGGLSKRATVLKLLERLEHKGFVRRDRSGAAQTFCVAVDRDTLIGNQLRRIAQRLSGNSLAPLLAHLVQSESLSDQERRELRELLDLWQPGRGERSVAKSPRKESR